MPSTQSLIKNVRLNMQNLYTIKVYVMFDFLLLQRNEKNIFYGKPFVIYLSLFNVLTSMFSGVLSALLFQTYILHQGKLEDFQLGSRTMECHFRPGNCNFHVQLSLRLEEPVR